MLKASKILRRAKHLDRLMGWIISFGGMLIIAAILGILVFIAREAFPLFRSPRTSAYARIQVPSPAGLLLDESGKAMMVLDPSAGVRAYTLPDGRQQALLAEGSSLPWKSCTPPDAKGCFSLLDHEGRLSLVQLGWNKPSSEVEPYRWTPEMNIQGAIPTSPEVISIYHVTGVEGGGLGEAPHLRIAARMIRGLGWAECPSDQRTPIVWNHLVLPEGQEAAAALWSGNGSSLYVGTRQGTILLYDVGQEAQLVASVPLSEGVSALGFALGQTTLLVGGQKGSISAVQALRKDGTAALQVFHRFQPHASAVLGFMPSLRDKRFLSWSSDALFVDHLTTERRLVSMPSEGIAFADLSTRGNYFVSASSVGDVKGWTLEAAHPEVSWKGLWGKVHYESYDKPEYVWQSTGATDDFEPKLSLVPLMSGTLKGTLYAMLFALPLAVLGALYTSQFATPRLRNTIKPLVEVMAALPSVVLGFMAGLVLAPLFERAAVHVLLLPFFILLAALILLPFWSRLPRPFRSNLTQGKEVVWLIPVILLGIAATLALAPAFERILLGGDFRAWLLQRHGLTYDQRNAIVVGFAMGFAVIPIIFTISEDALTSVPRSLTSASLACGASPWQTAWRVVLPTASPGIFSAVMIGFGRAIGETMIVLMATGNTPVMDWSPFNGMRTLSANIAVETPEAPVHGTLYRVLFLTALLLFLLTFILNTVAELVRQRLRKRYESF